MNFAGVFGDLKAGHVVTTSEAFCRCLTLRYDKSTCCIVILKNGEDVGNWEPTQMDILRSDWRVVEPAEVPPPEPCSDRRAEALRLFNGAVAALSCDDDIAATARDRLLDFCGPAEVPLPASPHYDTVGPAEILMTTSEKRIDILEQRVTAIEESARLYATLVKQAWTEGPVPS